MIWVASCRCQSLEHCIVFLDVNQPTFPSVFHLLLKYMVSVLTLHIIIIRYLGQNCFQDTLGIALYLEVKIVPLMIEVIHFYNIPETQ